MISGTIKFKILYYTHEFFHWIVDLLVSKKSSADVEGLQSIVNKMQDDIDQLSRRIDKQRKKLLMLELLARRPESPGVVFRPNRPLDHKNADS